MNTHKFIQRVNDIPGFHCKRLNNEEFQVVNSTQDYVITINVPHRYAKFNPDFTVEQWWYDNEFKQLGDYWHKYYDEVKHWKPLKDQWFK